jgi:ankyrin repeat protein
MGSGASRTNKYLLHPFIEACQTGNLEQVRQLLPTMTHKTINCVDGESNTGLHLACIQDNYELIHLILNSEKEKALFSRIALNNQGLKAYA